MPMNEPTLKQNQQPLDYSKIAQTSSFQELLRKKRNFIVPITLFYLAFYFTLPILTAYSTVLNKIAFGSLSWAWIFAFSQFIMTWTLCIVYSKKSAKFDEVIDEIKEQVAVFRGK